jgi:hypothetical protein
MPRRTVAVRYIRICDECREAPPITHDEDGCAGGCVVTAKPEPDDIDAVILLPANFADLVGHSTESALELEQMLLTRRPEELFAAEDESDWNDWVEFFSRTREFDGRRKGLVEIPL